MSEQQRLSAASEEWRRQRASDLHQAGWTGRAIAEALGVVPGAVSNWLRKVREGGRDALRPRRPQRGKRPKLSVAQQQHLLTLLSAGAETPGEIGARWTGKRVVALSQREFGGTYHPEYIPRLLRALGWTPQQPVQQAPQRDEAKIAAFKAQWEAVNKGRAKKAGRSCA